MVFFTSFAHFSNKSYFKKEPSQIMMLELILLVIQNTLILIELLMGKLTV